MSSNEETVVYGRHPRSRANPSRLATLRQPPDEEIDFSDHPEADHEAMKRAKRGVMYRAVKRQTTLRIDADVLEWFKQAAPDGKGYQTEINRVLREYVAKQVKKAG